MPPHLPSATATPATRAPTIPTATSLGLAGVNMTQTGRARARWRGGAAGRKMVAVVATMPTVVVEVATGCATTASPPPLTNPATASTTITSK